MTSPLPPNPASPEAMRLGYEPEQLRVRPVALVLVGLGVGAILLHVGLWALMKTFERINIAQDVPQSIVEAPQQQPWPRLQPSVGHNSMPYQDLESLRQEEDAEFSRWGWSVEPSTHRASVPPEIVQLTAAAEQQRQAHGPIPATTTGNAANSIQPQVGSERHNAMDASGGPRP